VKLVYANVSEHEQATEAAWMMQDCKTYWGASYRRGSSSDNLPSPFLSKRLKVAWLQRISVQFLWGHTLHPFPPWARWHYHCPSWCTWASLEKRHNIRRQSVQTTSSQPKQKRNQEQSVSKPAHSTIISGLSKISSSISISIVLDAHNLSNLSLGNIIRCFLQLYLGFGLPL